MKIEQFRFSADNLGYLLYAKKHAIAIDGGAPEQILAYAKNKGLTIAFVTNTHSHHDHTPGNQALLDKTCADFIDCRQIKADQEIVLDDQVVTLAHTPGHTTDSISFLTQTFMVTGDTLFNGTVGNCFSGDLDVFFTSLKRLIDLPLTTRIYAGHDYVAESVQAARGIEPNNEDIDLFFEKYDPGHVVSTVADELKVNPYIRFNAEEMKSALESQNLPCQTELDRFKSIMEQY